MVIIQKNFIFDGEALILVMNQNILVYGNEYDQ